MRVLYHQDAGEPFKCTAASGRAGTSAWLYRLRISTTSARVGVLQPVLAPIVIVAAAAVVIANILVDMIYALLDPRVKLH